MTSGTSRQRSDTAVGVQVPAGKGQGLRPVRLVRRHRPGWVAAGIALVALGVLANVFLFEAASHRVPVIRVARDVAVGQQITRADVDTAMVALGPEVHAIPARQLGEVVGKRAAVGLQRGTLLTASQLTSRLTPGPGQALVTVQLKAGQLPPQGLTPGSHVRIVATAGSQDEGATSAGTAAPADVPAGVDAVGETDADGAVSVSLLVAGTDASAVARLAAAGRVALVITSRTGA